MVQCYSLPVSCSQHGSSDDRPTVDNVIYPQVLLHAVSLSRNLNGILLDHRTYKVEMDEFGNLGARQLCKFETYGFPE